MQNYMPQQFNRQFNTVPGTQMFNPSLQQQNVLRMLAVTNKEEANATPVEFNGVPTFFYNQSTNEIYKKQFDINSGLAVLQEFKKSEPLPEPISKENEVLSINPYENDFKALNDKIDGLQKTFESYIHAQVPHDVKGVKNAK